LKKAGAEVKYFDTLQEAKEFCTEHNSVNNKLTVPDLYWVAKIDGE